MMALVRYCGKHRHAVERDLIALGFNGTEDVGTSRLSLRKLAAIVLASPPDSAVYFAETRSGRYSQNDQLLANLSEQQAGLMTLPGKYDRPGVDAEPIPASPESGDQFAALPGMTLGGTTVHLDVFNTPEAMREAREKVAAKVRESKKRDTVTRDKYDPFEAAKKARDERRRLGIPEGPPLPAHISGAASGPPLPSHVGGG
jgi:hypothetical protein